MICFVVNVYKEELEEVQFLIHSLRSVYPEDKIILLEDGGDTYFDVEVDLLKRFEHRKTSKWGGFWTHRYLDQALRAFQADHFIKVDPDTLIEKVAHQLPDGEVIFSAVYTHAMGPGQTWAVPHGGALGFTYQAAKRVVNERLMLDPRFCNNPSYHAWNDLMLADAIKWSGMTLTPRLDFDCGKTRRIGPSTTFAHTH